MKSIPSLVATSTVGVAVTGLAFGRPQLSSPPRPASNKRKAAEYDMEQRALSSSRSRPATSSTLATPIREEALSSQLPASMGSGPRFPTDRTSPNEDGSSPVLNVNSASRRRDVLSPQDHGAGSRRDSLSSRNSWIRRLSTIQVSSHHGSPRSSIGPDSPSLTFTNGSTAPMLDTAGSPIPLPPNKLVKRTTSGRLLDGDTPVRNGSRSQVPTLRRPATSHQRSVTLQQQLRRDRTDSPDVPVSQQVSHTQTPQRVIVGNFPPLDSRTPWRLYFESRPTKLSKERPSAKSSDSNMDAFYPTSKRIILPEASTAPYLLKATMIIESGNKSIPNWMATFPAQAGDSPTSTDLECPPITVDEEEPHKRPRRSLSMNFTSPSTWITRSSSMRALKRGAAAKATGKRYSSAPITPGAGRGTSSAHGAYGHKRKGILDPNVYASNVQKPTEDQELQDTTGDADIRTRTRNNSSPLPPISRLSSFNVDLTRLGLSSSSSSAPQQSPTSANSPNSPVSPILLAVNGRPQVKSSPKVIIHQDTSPRIPEVTGSDRASTLIGSDSENRGFTSGEEDEMDFQSDTVFDSYRTGTTGSIRVRNPPLELMFDDSPPNNGHKIKTTIIRDMGTNGPFRESIVEEDEGMVTPIKARRGSDKDRLNTPSTPIKDNTEILQDEMLRSSQPSFSMGSKEFARLSLEDDEEEDWTKDDDSVTISNPLSPPSSPLNSRRISSAVRTALADLTKTGSSSGNAAPIGDRPRSLFDWSEPTNAEKVDVMGNSPRPKTVHGKQVIDGRGGRTVGRKGPNALHIRSQSVPVVPDVAGHREHGKLAPKFGTWGLGGKGVNEDWDNDFEFDGIDVDQDDNANDSMSGSGMLVPEAIQASQANVVGHVGQIREVCLLVEDLKRLRGLAREKGILDGTSASLWREAEGIIALAIPDEEDETLSPPQSPSYSFERESIDDRYHDGGFDVDELSEGNGSIQENNRPEWATGTVHDGLQVRRQSVFSPEDDIFGAGGAVAIQLLGEEKMHSMKAARQARSKDSTEVARTVMEHIHQHRATSDPLRSDTSEGLKKMPFDTTSLRDLVHRANALSRALAEIIRKADGSSQSPHRSPKNDIDSSPAFTRVFTEPLTSPPKHLLRSQSNNSILSSSMDASPTRGLGKRMQVMTVV